MNEMYFVEQSDPEWEHMWGMLADHPINDGFSEPTEAASDNGECWQYLGTEHRKSEGQWKHCFRHRSHPKTDQREYRWFPAPAPKEGED